MSREELEAANATTAGNRSYFEELSVGAPPRFEDDLSSALLQGTRTAAGRMRNSRQYRAAVHSRKLAAELAANKLAATAVEELLRFDAAMQLSSRSFTDAHGGRHREPQRRERQLLARCC